MVDISDVTVWADVVLVSQSGETPRTSKNIEIEIPHNESIHILIHRYGLKHAKARLEELCFGEFAEHVWKELKLGKRYPGCVNFTVRLGDRYNPLKFGVYDEDHFDDTKGN